MKWFNNLKVGAKIISGFLLVLVLMLVLATVAIVELREVESLYENIATYPMEARRIVLEFRLNNRNLQRVTAAIAASTVRNDQQKIESLYQEGLEAYNSSLAHLQEYKTLYTDNPRLADESKRARDKDTDALLTALDEYKRVSLDAVIVAARAGDYNQAVDIITDTEADLERLKNISTDIQDLTVTTARAGIDNAATTAGNAITILFIVSAVIVLVSLLLGFILSSVISKPIKRMVRVADSVAKGDFNVNIDASARDESGVLAGSLKSLVEVFKTLMMHMEQMADNHDKGEIEVFLHPDEYPGNYGVVAEKVNQMVATHIDTMKVSIGVFNAMVDGHFDARLDKLPGKLVFINEAVDNMRLGLKQVNAEIAATITAVIDGKLDTRANVAAYKGDWAALISKLDTLMDAVSAPMNEISKVMRNVSLGAFDLNVTGDYKGDFLAVKTDINATVTNIASYIDEISRVLSGLAQNDLTQGISREYVGTFAHIKNAMNNIIETFNNVIGDITAAAEQVSAGAKSISESSMTLATGATEQASSVEELNATVLTINESSVRNTENAKTAEALSNASKDNASKGDNDMQVMLHAMEGIKDSSDKISKIIKVIEDIAFQTNLLALNAAVEAARAGEHGKGFAVVAEEVRTLASRSQTAAKETAALIEESINRVEEGAKVADKTAGALRAMVGDIDKTAELVTGIAAASNSQTEAVAQVALGLEQITGVVQNNSATSEESASAAEELASQSEVMRNLVSVFSLKRR